MKSNKLFLLHYKEARSMGASVLASYKSAKAFIESLCLVA
jgi:hypothetical protein